MSGLWYQHDSGGRLDAPLFWFLIGGPMLVIGWFFTPLLLVAWVWWCIDQNQLAKRDFFFWYSLAGTLLWAVVITLAHVL